MTLKKKKNAEFLCLRDIVICIFALILLGRCLVWCFCVTAFGVETFVICSEDQPTKARVIVVVKRVSCCDSRACSAACSGGV